MATRNSTSKSDPAPKPAPGALTITFLPTLIDVKHRLDVILCVLAVAAKALEHQAADIDIDVARVLRRSVIDPLAVQIDQLEEIVKRFRPEKR